MPDEHRQGLTVCSPVLGHGDAHPTALIGAAMSRGPTWFQEIQKSLSQLWQPLRLHSAGMPAASSQICGTGPEQMLDTERIRKGMELGRLVITATSAHLPLQGASVCVGRCPTKSQIVVTGPSVSRCHCQFFFADGHTYIEDLNSRNGTWVNGTRIQRVPLVHGAIVHLGLEQFVFEEGLRKNCRDFSDSEHQSTQNIRQVA